jgi:MoxR-like ATPase
MFDSITDLTSKLAATGYFIDPVMTQVVFLAAKLRKPLLLEGPAGSGKSQIVSQVANDLDYDFLDVRAVQLDPVDLRGLPRIPSRWE